MITECLFQTKQLKKKRVAISRRQTTLSLLRDLLYVITLDEESAVLSALDVSHRQVYDRRFLGATHRSPVLIYLLGDRFPLPTAIALTHLVDIAPKQLHLEKVMPIYLTEAYEKD
ncbi:hypothetical protein PoB_005599400 [Plakobranchus ocellatus]|uniref:Uncharacterized protein n=1 Tax=Plakobranchus ocellatus TaxID=259542 RepID=A0AAV4CFF8_9GAST|nr:hypothetical protein PoB_005599400 [Plakobranchus ocellatus]